MGLHVNSYCTHYYTGQRGKIIKKITTEESKKWSLLVITGWSDQRVCKNNKEMTGLSLGTRKSGRNNEVVVLTGWHMVGFYYKERMCIWTVDL